MKWALAAAGLLILAFLISAGANYDLEQHSSNTIVSTTGRQGEPEGEHTSAAPHSVAPRLVAATHPALQRVDELFNASGVNDLVGREVDFEVDFAAHPGMASSPARFWIGTDDGRRMLVVYKRDKRTGAQEIEGEPPIHGIAPIEAGKKYSIRGVIERLPRAEQMFSWELSRGDLRTLAQRPVYIRADTVQPVI